ncbi:MAG: cupin domain-containing protein [Alphaproteobacteria bacterium]
MAKKSPSMQKKTLNSPDDVRVFEKGKLELASIGTVTFGRGVFQPGWKWSESVKPLVKTDYREAPHIQYHVSGRLGVRMADGTEEEFGPGDVGVLPPGHDAWVIGDEEVVVIDISGMKEYAKPAKKTTAKKARKAKPKKRRR